MNEKGKGHSWVHRLFFNSFFEDALAKARVKTGLGETFAILNALNEYWYEHGFMREDGYFYNKERYGVGLIEQFKKSLEPKESTILKVKSRREARIEENLKTIYRDWDSVSEKARKYALKKANEHPEFPISEMILKRHQNE
ncbi:MAG: hypothetical protein U9O89_04570 [Thermoproteota archaeon]|nr:hypothetical protein [Thermoproteota archaeon]